MTRASARMHHMYELGHRIVRPGGHDRHGGGQRFKDLSALPVCGAGVRPLSSQRAMRTP